MIRARVPKRVAPPREVDAAPLAYCRMTAYMTEAIIRGRPLTSVWNSLGERHPEPHIINYPLGA